MTADPRDAGATAGGPARRTPAAGGRRAYRSARRQEQATETRALVVAAATSLFSERGWAMTGMRDVAASAGVSVETVYANFRSKSELLLTAIDVGVVGDTDPVPLSQRPEYAALATGSFGDRVATAARLLTVINSRGRGLHRALYEAAGGDARIEAALHRLELRRRDNIADAAALVTGGPVGDDVLDQLWALLSSHTFSLFTHIAGRSVQEYERWLATTIATVLRSGPP